MYLIYDQSTDMSITQLHKMFTFVFAYGVTATIVFQ